MSRGLTLRLGSAARSATVRKPGRSGRLRPESRVRSGTRWEKASSESWPVRPTGAAHGGGIEISSKCEPTFRAHLEHHPPGSSGRMRDTVVPSRGNYGDSTMRIYKDVAER